jgi:hypothetical protein
MLGRRTDQLVSKESPIPHSAEYSFRNRVPARPNLNLSLIRTGEIFDLSAIGRSFDRQKKGYCTALVDARPFLFARRINTFVKN